MRTYLDCIPCFTRQAVDAVRLVTNDASKHERVLREILQLMSAMDLHKAPPAMGKEIHRLIRKLTQNDDPYRQMKDRFNTFALALYPSLEQLIAESEKPLETAVRLALAGNIIDLGAKCSVKTSDVKRTIDEALMSELDGTSLRDFKAGTAAARTILYLGDNAGEIVFDRFLIEQLGPEKTTFVVKGKPVINDATMWDAQAVGLTDLVSVIDTGDDAPGTILDTCSTIFRSYFEAADVVIAKGQGNYETLSDVHKNIFFLLKAKCPVIARDLGCEVGKMVLRKRRALSDSVDSMKGEQANAKV